MAAAPNDVATFPQTEPLESGGAGVTYPEPVAPPRRDLYPDKVQASDAPLPTSQRPDVYATTTVSPPPPAIPERHGTSIVITVTDPVKETIDGRIPGTKSTYHTYCVNVESTLPRYQGETSVRRRFRDFVDLSNLLNENYRKLLMKPKFIEERRVLLERYLRALASHPTISQSDELRVFLETGGRLIISAEWKKLHTVQPSFFEGTSKFFRQMIGKERITPSAADVSQPTTMRKDFVWSFRNSMKNLEDRRRPQIYEGPEFELREERVRLEEFKKDVDATWKWASYWIDRTDAMARATDTIAAAMSSLAGYEAEARYLRLEAPGVIGKGATRANGIYRQSLQDASNPLSTLYNYTEMMRPVLAAMKSREQALNTVEMLERDLETKKAKLRQLEIQPAKQARVEQLREDISAVEASLMAAQSYYVRVTKNNTEEAERFRTYRSEDWMEMLRTLADVELETSQQLCGVWLEVAKELGADVTSISSN